MEMEPPKHKIGANMATDEEVARFMESIMEPIHLNYVSVSFHTKLVV
jgi:hypothetical protein